MYTISLIPLCCAHFTSALPSPHHLPSPGIHFKANPPLAE